MCRAILISALHYTSPGLNDYSYCHGLLITLYYRTDNSCNGRVEYSLLGYSPLAPLSIAPLCIAP